MYHLKYYLMYHVLKKTTTIQQYIYIYLIITSTNSSFLPHPQLPSHVPGSSRAHGRRGTPCALPRRTSLERPQRWGVSWLNHGSKIVGSMSFWSPSSPWVHWVYGNGTFQLEAPRRLFPHLVDEVFELQSLNEIRVPRGGILNWANWAKNMCPLRDTEQKSDQSIKCLWLLLPSIIINGYITHITNLCPHQTANRILFVEPAESVPCRTCHVRVLTVQLGRRGQRRLKRKRSSPVEAIDHRSRPWMPQTSSPKDVTMSRSDFHPMSYSSYW
jgi:hypothetical protein